MLIVRLLGSYTHVHVQLIVQINCYTFTGNGKLMIIHYKTIYFGLQLRQNISDLEDMMNFVHQGMFIHRYR